MNVNSASCAVNNVIASPLPEQGYPGIPSPCLTMALQADVKGQMPLFVAHQAQLKPHAPADASMVASHSTSVRSELTVLDRQTRYMKLQGELIRHYPEVNYEMAVMLTHPVDDAELPSLPYGEDLHQLTENIHQLFNVSSHHQFPSLVQLAAILDEACGKIAERLEMQHALYQEVLANPGLSLEDKCSVEISQGAFQNMAQRWAEGLKEKLFEFGVEQSTLQLAAAQADLDHLERYQTQELFEFEARLERAKNEVVQWSFIQTFFQHYKQDPTTPAALAERAIKQVSHRQFIAELHKKNNAQNGIKTFLAAGTPQGFASMLQFVIARASVDHRLSFLNHSARSVVSGALTGVTHETLDNFFKPSVKEIMASLNMVQMERVNPEQAIPDPARFISEKGRVRLRTDKEMQIAQYTVNKARNSFVNAQNNYKDGVLSGDAVTYGSLTAAQLVRETLNQTTAQDTTTTLAGMATAFSGGFLRSGLQAKGQQHNTFYWQGSTIPTHVPETVSGSLTTRLRSTLDKALPTINPLSQPVRENYLSKIWSASEGMLPYYALGSLGTNTDTSQAGGKATAIVLNGIQTLVMQIPFYANKQSGLEAKANGTGRFATAIANVRQPGRETLLHGTQPGTWGRTAENRYHQLRGVTQVTPQAITEVSSAIIHAIGALSDYMGRQANHMFIRRPREPIADIEMGRRTSQRG